MPGPLLHPQEVARLKALRDYELLDTLPEAALDELTALAAHVCGVPMSAISLVDENRQWFKSRMGLALAQSARDESFCGHAILGTDVFVIPDAARDERFHDSPLVVEEPGIRFYAGAPLINSEGLAVGALCVMDREPRELDDHQREMLALIGRQVVAQFELRRQARLVLASETRYRTLIEHAPDGIIVADDEGTYLDVNATMCTLLGYSREELVGINARSVVAPSEIDHIGPALRQLTARETHSREWRFLRKDGSTFPADVIATSMADGTLLAMVRDVTERRRVEARFRRLVDSSAQGVFFWEAAGRITAANDTFLETIGRDRTHLESEALTWTAITPPEYRAQDERASAEIAATGACKPFEKEFIRRDGTRVPVLIGAAAFEDSPDEGVGFVVDLSERKRLEAQFLRAQRLESIGTLAGGIAHDLNNVLAPILLAVEMLRPLADTESDREVLETIEGSARRGADLVRQVLAFARGVDGRRLRVDVRALVQDVHKVLRETFPKAIDIRYLPTTDAWSVTGDPTQLHQVVLNLCVNARDAMPHGGVLTVAIENLQIDETYAAMNVSAEPGPYVVITVSDTGTGIEPEIRDRLFEPFFTTKEPGRGTGLGLSTTQAIVKSHGGFIHLYSEVGHGTRFRVFLPARADEAGGGEVNDDAAALPRGDGETVLVVDDEAVIRSVASSTLERFGYRVLTASHGAEAVAIYASRGEEIDAVITDMAMPVMDGPATIVALKSLNPRVRIIGTSGLATSEGIAKSIGAGVKRFIPKPYSAESMLTALRSLLREPVTGPAGD